MAFISVLAKLGTIVICVSIIVLWSLNQVLFIFLNDSSHLPLLKVSMEQKKDLFVYFREIAKHHKQNSFESGRSFESLHNKRASSELYGCHKDVYKFFSKYFNLKELTPTSSRAIPSAQHEAFLLFEARKLESADLIKEHLIFTRADCFSEFLVEEAEIRRSVVRSAICMSWIGLQHAGFSTSEVNPVTGKPTGSNFWGNLPISLIDYLDTLWIAELPNFFYEGTNYLDTHSNFLETTQSKNAVISTFEITIRMLGGFTSAYTLSKENSLKNYGERLGNVLIEAFGKPEKLSFLKATTKPHYCSLLYDSDASLQSQCFKHSDRDFVVNSFPAPRITVRGTHTQLWPTNLAEVATYQLEFISLSTQSGDCKFHHIVDATVELLDFKFSARASGLIPNHLQDRSSTSSITLGGEGDSAYEYFIKEYILTNSTDLLLFQTITSFLKQLNSVYTLVESKEFEDASELGKFDTMEDTFEFGASPSRSKRFFFPNLFLRSDNTLIADNNNLHLEHLECFLPGTIALLRYHSPNKFEWNETTVHAMTQMHVESCVLMYFDYKTGLAPERVHYAIHEKKLSTTSDSAFSYLRPETLESLFILNEINPRPEFSQWAWRIILSMINQSSSPFGFSSVNRLNNNRFATISNLPEQPSWFLAETLKYAYLIFSNTTKLINTLITEKKQMATASKKPNFFDYYMLTTEAHLVPLYEKIVCGRAASLVNS